MRDGAKVTRLVPGRRRDGGDVVITTLRDNAATLLRIARRYSLCEADAEDAYQRGVEIFLRRAASLTPDGMAPWMRTVVKHEALAIRAKRLDQVGGDDGLEQRPAPDVRTPDEQLAAFELMARSAEALQQLKPQELRALLLKAEGYSYREICDLTGWTYTKVNRCITEGRRSFLDRCESIETGRECERFAPVLSAMADGEAPPRQLLAVRPHLRNCPSCRATLASHRRAPARVAAVVPVAVLGVVEAGADGVPGMALRLFEGMTSGVYDRATLSAGRLQAGVEAFASGKVVAATASAAALAGGGVAAVGLVDRAPAEPPAASPDRTDQASERGRDDAAATPAPAPSGPDAEIVLARGLRESHRPAERPDRDSGSGGGDQMSSGGSYGGSGGGGAWTPPAPVAPPPPPPPPPVAAQEFGLEGATGTYGSARSYGGGGGSYGSAPAGGGSSGGGSGGGGGSTTGGGSGGGGSAGGEFSP